MQKNLNHTTVPIRAYKLLTHSLRGLLADYTMDFLGEFSATFAVLDDILCFVLCQCVLYGHT